MIELVASTSGREFTAGLFPPMNGKNLTKPPGGRKQKMDFVFTKRTKNGMTEHGVFSHPVA
jgi:hypothetical protein